MPRGHGFVQPASGSPCSRRIASAFGQKAFQRNYSSSKGSYSCALCLGRFDRTSVGPSVQNALCPSERHLIASARGPEEACGQHARVAPFCAKRRGCHVLPPSMRASLAMGTSLSMQADTIRPYSRGSGRGEDLEAEATAAASVTSPARGLVASAAKSPASPASPRAAPRAEERWRRRRI